MGRINEFHASFPNLFMASPAAAAQSCPFMTLRLKAHGAKVYQILTLLLLLLAHLALAVSLELLIYEVNEVLLFEGCS